MSTAMQGKLSEPMLMPDQGYMIESGKMEIKPELVSCQEVLDEVSTMLHSLAQAKGLRLDIIVPVTQINIQTDRHALSQILLNLADHAIRFTDNGGICIELRRRMGADFTKVSTEFSVEDTGVGMHPEQQLKLFKILRQLGNSTMRYLSQCQTLARLIGGHIEMMSVHGQGTIFRLVIPEK